MEMTRTWVSTNDQGDADVDPVGAALPPVAVRVALELGPEPESPFPSPESEPEPERLLSEDSVQYVRWACSLR